MKRAVWLWSELLLMYVGVPALMYERILPNWPIPFLLVAAIWALLVLRKDAKFEHRGLVGLARIQSEFFGAAVAGHSAVSAAGHRGAAFCAGDAFLAVPAISGVVAGGGAFLSDFMTQRERLWELESQMGPETSAPNASSMMHSDGGVEHLQRIAHICLSGPFHVCLRVRPSL